MKFIYSFVRSDLLIVIVFLIDISCFGQLENGGRNIIEGLKNYNNWKIKDSTEVYSGENLYSYIDGGADVYHEFGFEELVVAKYFNHRAISIKLEIFRMASDSSAYGIFSVNSAFNGSPVNCGQEGFIYDYYLDFLKGYYYIRCISSSNEKSIQDTLKIFACKIDSMIFCEGSEPDIVRKFTMANPDFNNIKYIRGIIGLGNIFNFGHNAIAGFKEGVVGYKSDELLFVFNYDNAEKSQEWFASAEGKVSMNRKFGEISEKDSGFTVKDKEGNNYSFMNITRNIIIIKGMGWEEAQPIMEKLKGTLK